MATLPEARGRGAARTALASLADWAAARGASAMYLQVENDNGPALRLYDRTCFAEVCGYHYRTGPPPRITLPSIASQQVGVPSVARDHVQQDPPQ